MKLIIHRGTHEIGGSCVEIIGEESRIVLDLGMPLVDKNRERFNFRDYRGLTGPQLVERGILPDVSGFYSWDRESERIAGLLVSHPHQDHYGFINYLDDTIPVYLGEAAKKLIDLTVFFTPIEGNIANPRYITSGESFRIAEFIITPYLMDHSAFDSYAFLIKAQGKTILYSGDFREHGRKSKAFYWFLHNVPENVDALLLEGTCLGRENQYFPRETDIEKEMIEIAVNTRGIVLIHQSSQNIDRLVSFYRAAIQSGRIFVVDIYTAHVLNHLKEHARIPHPSRDFPNVRVFYPWRLANRIANEGHRDKLNQFSSYKITRKEIARDPAKIMMLVRPTMLSDLKTIDSFTDASYVYSLWEGYLGEENRKMEEMLQYIRDKKMDFIKLHTSGHASVQTLAKVIKRADPARIIPIHTFHPGRYQDLDKMDNRVMDVSDGEEIII